MLKTVLQVLESFQQEEGNRSTRAFFVENERQIFAQSFCRRGNFQGLAFWEELWYTEGIFKRGAFLMKTYAVEELKNMKQEEVIALMLQVQSQALLFEEQLAVLRAQLFGRKTEKLETINPNQECLFNEAEAEKEDEKETEEEPEIEKVVTVRPKRPRGKLEEDLKGIPVRVEQHELSEEKLNKVFGPNGWKRLPDEVYRKLEYHPATREVVEHHIAVYAAKDDNQVPQVQRAPRPAELMVHSIATPSLVAAIMNAKYTNAMPLYRIAQEFGRNDVTLTVPTMANWVIRCAERYLSLLWDRLKSELCQLDVVQADETTCSVTKDGRPANAKSYMFVYRSGELYRSHIIILYDYQKTRSAEHLLVFLKDFSGILVSDAYSGYHALDSQREDIRVAHCWAHARRDFADALKAMRQKGGPSKQHIKKTIAHQALERIASIYALEDEWKDLSPEERLIRRQEHSKPLVEAYFAWLKSIDLTTISSQKTKDGINYSINQEKYLRVFLENGEVPIDNSASERAIRPFCVGRANWHLIDTIHGANASAIVYSIVETAKANQLKPYFYLEYLLSEIPKHMDDADLSFLDDLLPWSDALPDSCKKTSSQTAPTG